jgi:hypothetical protein
MDHRRIVTLAWVLVIGLIAWQDLRKSPTLPSPRRMVRATVLYSMLAVLGEFMAPLASTLAVGYVLALLMFSDAIPAYLNPPPATLGPPGPWQKPGR